MVNRDNPQHVEMTTYRSGWSLDASTVADDVETLFDESGKIFGTVESWFEDHEPFDQGGAYSRFKITVIVDKL